MKNISFGEYFDNQRIRLEKMMQDKNKQLNVEWMERYEKRKALTEISTNENVSMDTNSGDHRNNNW